MANKITNFQVKIRPQRANTGTMETLVRETLASLGITAGVSVLQKDDYTLDVTVAESEVKTGRNTLK